MSCVLPRKEAMVIIEKYKVDMSASHQKTDILHVEERLNAWTDGGQQQEAAREKILDGQPANTADFKTFDFESELAKVSLEAHRERLESSHKANVKSKEKKEDEPLSKDTKLEVMRLLVEEFSGEKLTIYNAKTRVEDDAVENNAEGEGDVESPEMERAGFGIEYDYKEVHVESETTQFKASGKVTAADGRKLSFNIDMEMHREQLDVKSFSLRAGDAKLVDPLVVNLGTGPAGLTDETIDFDLNQDGQAEQISFVRSGSGFLVLDKNQDGRVNDGGELFGPSSGDGFKELAAYDDDRNGWIDETDNVYDQLRIWSQAGGNHTLSSLKESNVGAIYLGNVSTPFDVKSQDNTLLGQVQSSGVYLRESGEAGTIQQLDLVT